MGYKRHSSLSRFGAVAGIAALLLTACGDDEDAADTGADDTATTAAAGTETTAVEASGEPWEFALLNDVTGTIAVSFAPASAGFDSYIDMVNDEGGVHGRPIDVTLYDAQSNPDVALTEAQRALGDEPLAFLHMGSSAAAARVQPIVSEAGLAYIGGSLGDDAVNPVQPGVFQVGVTPTLQAEAAVAQIENLLGTLEDKTVAIAGGNSPFIDALISVATGLIEDGGGSIGRVERFDFGIPSFTAQASNIAQDDPDAVYLLAPANDTINAGRALLQAGLEVPIVTFNGSAAQEVVEQLATDLYHAPTEVEYPSANEEYLAVAAEYGREAEVRASHFSAIGWSMAAILVEALEQCGPECTAEAFGDAVERISDFEVPLGISYGPINFGPDDHIAFEVMRFHSFDPDAGELVEGEPVELG